MRKAAMLYNEITRQEALYLIRIESRDRAL